MVQLGQVEINLPNVDVEVSGCNEAIIAIVEPFHAKATIRASRGTAKRNARVHIPYTYAIVVGAAHRGKVRSIATKRHILDTA